MKQGGEREELPAFVVRVPSHIERKRKGYMVTGDFILQNFRVIPCSTIDFVLKYWFPEPTYRISDSVKWRRNQIVLLSNKPPPCHISC
jgi:hypothetical protein